MSLLTSAFSAAGDLVTGWLNNEAAEDRQNSAQNFSADQFAHRYQTTVQDMKAAGLNPMLAYSQGGGSPPSGSAASSAGTPSIGHSISSAYNLDVERERTQSQTENLDVNTIKQRAETYLAEAQTTLSLASADQSRAVTHKLEAEAKKISEEIKNIPLEGDRLIALAKNLHASTGLINAQSSTEVQRQAQMKWLALKTMLESDLLSIDLKASQDLNNLGAYSREGKVILDVLRMFRR